MGDELSVLVGVEASWVDANGVEHEWSQEFIDADKLAGLLVLMEGAEKCRQVRGSPKRRREKKRRGKFVRLVG